MARADNHAAANAAARQASDMLNAVRREKSAAAVAQTDTNERNAAEAKRSWNNGNGTTINE